MQVCGKTYIINDRYKMFFKYVYRFLTSFKNPEVSYNPLIIFNTKCLKTQTTNLRGKKNTSKQAQLILQYMLGTQVLYPENDACCVIKW